jgi:hypothetical protein
MLMWLRPCNSVSLRTTRSLPDASDDEVGVALPVRSADGVAAGALVLLARLVVSACAAGRRRLNVEGRVMFVIRCHRLVDSMEWILNDNHSYLQEIEIHRNSKLIGRRENDRMGRIQASFRISVEAGIQCS